MSVIFQLLPTRFRPKFKQQNNNNMNKHNNKNKTTMIAKTTTTTLFYLSLTGFWPNFKHRFLGTSRLDSSCHSDICPGNICLGYNCPYQEYLSHYWLNFDETLKLGYWEYLEQILTVTVTFVLATFVHIRSISTFTRFGPNFKCSFLGQSLTDANCYGDICPGNISSGDICPNKQYFSCYWSDFDQTPLTQFFWGHNFCGPKCSWAKLFQDTEFN